jgi:hypothetical protein
MITAVAIGLVVCVALGTPRDPGDGVPGRGSLIAAVLLGGSVQLLTIGPLARRSTSRRGRLLCVVCSRMILNSPQDAR